MCEPGYYLDPETSVCVPVLQFGGALVLESTSSRRVKRDTSDTYTEVYNFLVKTYNETDGYKDVTVEVEPEILPGGLQSWRYVVLYDTTSSVTVETLQKEMTEALSAPTTISGFAISVDDTKSSTGDTKSVCNMQECDAKSTTCDVNLGTVTCECRSGYSAALGSKVACLEIVCENDSDCNSPYGTCTQSKENMFLGECECAYLYMGVNCGNPWLLVFVVVMCIFGALMLMLVIVYCVRHRSRFTRKEKSLVLSSFYDPTAMAMPESSLRARVPSDAGFHNTSFKE